LNFQKLTLPNSLTLIRLICSPLFLPLFFVYLLPQNIVWVNCVLALIFIFFSLTDFFDGFLARRYGQESEVGKVLDPIADKFLLYATLIALQAAGKLYFYWVIILVGREFFVMGLRIIMLQHKINIPVSFAAKIKTALQMVFLTFVIINPYQALGMRKALWWNGIEYGLLALTIYLSLATAKNYYKEFMNRLREEQLMQEIYPEIIKEEVQKEE
jgi:CDP-diacylglycerol---glycerol-3-phosphate 3-phosphatidyltransferase